MSSLSPGRVWPAASRVASALLLAACASADRVVAPAVGPRGTVSAAALPSVRISEFHYDNAGTDTGEAIEVSFPVGTDLTGWRIVRYNGSTPTSAVIYTTPTPTVANGETLSNQTPTACTGGSRAVVVVRYPTDGLQNGTNDGFALVNGSTVVELLSYEGALTVAASAAVGAGLTSTDVGVSQTGATTLDPVGASLQRTASNTWTRTAANTFGACNDGLSDETPPPVDIGPLASVTVSPAARSLEVGQTTTLTAVAEDAEGDDITTGTIVWSDGDSPSVTVTPSTDGRSASVRGDLAGGPVTITATLTRDGVTRSGSAQVTVTAAGVSDDISFLYRGPDQGLALPVGFDAQLVATARRGGSNNPAATVAAWTSLNDVATVDARGIVTALRAGTMQIRATLTDGYSEVFSAPTVVAQAGDAARYADPLQFGTPTDGNASDDFVLTRNGYVASYNRHTNRPNWTAYNLDRDNKGDIPGLRCDCFTFDPELRAAGFTEVTTADYTGSGFSRGHMVVSNDRELGYLDQAQTYYLSNIVPQNGTQNSGPWGDLETHLLTQLAQGANRELFILTGPAGVILTGTDTAKVGGKVAIPTHTWKIAVVLERDRSIAGVRSASDVVDVIAVLMPNTAAANSDWRASRTTVDAIEAATGYDFLAALPDGLEAQLEGSAPATRALGLELQPERISVTNTAAVNAVLLSAVDFDAAAVPAADLRLVTASGQQAIPLSRSGVVNTSVRDVNGDGRPDRVVAFAMTELRAKGFSDTAPELTLRRAGTGAPAWLASDATPPTVLP
jgi:DNA/RNA endonuclease G (NUC1)